MRKLSKDDMLFRFEAGVIISLIMATAVFLYLLSLMGEMKFLLWGILTLVSAVNAGLVGVVMHHLQGIYSTKRTIGVRLYMVVLMMAMSIILLTVLVAIFKRAVTIRILFLMCGIQIVDNIYALVIFLEYKKELLG